MLPQRATYKLVVQCPLLEVQVKSGVWYDLTCQPCEPYVAEYIIIHNRAISELNGAFVGSWSPLIFHWLFCGQQQYFLTTCGACLEVVSEFEGR